MRGFSLIELIIVIALIVCLLIIMGQEWPRVAIGMAIAIALAQLATIGITLYVKRKDKS